MDAFINVFWATKEPRDFAYFHGHVKGLHMSVNCNRFIGNPKENMPNFSVSIVPSDGLAQLGTNT